MYKLGANWGRRGIAMGVIRILMRRNSILESNIVQTTGSVVIACQGSETAGDNPTIYFLNDKTFVMENIIEIKHLQKHFGKLKVLNDIDFNIKKGEVVTIIGSSGSGKSTLLRCINLLEVPDGGQIIFNGQNVLTSKFKLTEYRTKVGMVFQNFNLFNNKNVLDNCIIGQTKVLKRSYTEAKQKAIEHLTSVGMQDFIDAPIANLSGGQKQRVAIAGILAMSPEIIIFDEATSMLDPKGKAEIKEVIYDLHEKYDITIISITHDIEEALNSDYVIVMNQGKIYKAGKPSEVFSDTNGLLKIGLDIPFTYKIKEELRQYGIKVGEYKDIEGLVEALWQLNSKR